MKKIDPIKAIAPQIKAIRAKLEINAQDWTKAEKEQIAEAYHAITKLSTGKARNLDTGCVSCVNSAVSIIKNYCTAIGEPIKVKPVKAASKTTPATVSKPKADAEENEDDDSAEGNDDGKLFAPANSQWRKNVESIDAAAKELEYTFTEKAVTKKEKIAELEAHIEKINAE